MVNSDANSVAQTKQPEMPTACPRIEVTQHTVLKTKKETTTYTPSRTTEPHLALLTTQIGDGVKHMANWIPGD